MFESLDRTLMRTPRAAMTPMSGGRTLLARRYWPGSGPLADSRVILTPKTCICWLLLRRLPAEAFHLVEAYRAVGVTSAHP
jgi:hypothetical protein